LLRNGIRKIGKQLKKGTWNIIGQTKKPVSREENFGEKRIREGSRNTTGNISESTRSQVRDILNELLNNKGGEILFEKVETKEIESILERLEAELKSENILYRRREEVKSLVNYLKTWLEWKNHREREHYREVIKSES